MKVYLVWASAGTNNRGELLRVYSDKNHAELYVKRLEIKQTRWFDQLTVYTITKEELF